MKPTCFSVGIVWNAEHKNVAGWLDPQESGIYARGKKIAMFQRRPIVDCTATQYISLLASLTEREHSYSVAGYQIATLIEL